MRRLSVVITVVWLLGCGDATGILVDVRSPDLSVPDDVDALRFEAVADSGRTIDRTFALSGAFPHSLTLVPSDEGDTDVTLSVSGLREGEVVVRRVVRSAFQRGSTRRIEVILSRQCLGVICPDGVDCVAGRCEEPPPLDGGVDAGMDGGTLDAGPGVDAGPGEDAGPAEDAGTDAGTEPDAGTDAGDGTFRCDGETCRGLIVISELRTRGPDGATDEFVELYNRSGLDVNVQGLDLRYRSSSGTEAGRATVSSRTVIPAGGFLLFGSSGFSGPTPDVPDHWSSGFADGGGSVLIVAGGEVIDLVGWGSAVTPNVEGSAIAPDCEISCERKARATSTAASMSSGGADEDDGNGFDSDVNAADFVRRSSAEPQGLSSPLEML
ncbi:MAG TPA: lamin tail domain-containing protein [Sandaracinaceae bacterium LLY-WYZ-13_1]|nr:lamin tail domain-containing protein [Sandaracinaceae bacterium LLY-WYZ-13_1]